MSETVLINGITKWYGQVIGVNDVSFRIGPGVTGLLGPNGAGKTTLLKLIVGHIKPNQGQVDVCGENPFLSHGIKERMGYVPEEDGLPDRQAGLGFLRNRAFLRGYSSSQSRHLAQKVFAAVGLDEAGNKKIGAYSKGMRQRLKLAQAIFHGPEIIILDEPLTGLDPKGRRQLIERIKELGREGRTVLVSSHILYEVELMTDQIILIARGKVLAEGTIEHIRSLIDAHPHTVDIESPQRLELASELLRRRCVVSVNLDDRGNLIQIKTRTPDDFYDVLGRLVVEEGFEVDRIHSPDNNLQAVFDYLVK